MSDRQIALRKFFIKLLHWEYWPFGIVQFPAILYYLCLSLKERTFLFFSASNPGIDMGGMFGESKFDVLKKIPAGYSPKTLLIKLPTTFEQLMIELAENNLNFPLIFKPDIGERGYRVRKIITTEDARSYLLSAPFDFLIQELVDKPIELGVFYARYPDEPNGKVTSVVIKEMLFVVGDGISSLRELILKNDRALLQWEKLKVKYQPRLDEIISPGNRIELVSIGNHVLGTKFLNGNYLINDRLHEVFNSIAIHIEGFFFGRFDIRCDSFEDLYKGNISILELNGCGAEPAHIYDPEFKLIDAIGVLLNHWRTIFQIAKQNHNRGIQYIRYREAKMFYRKFKNAIR